MEAERDDNNVPSILGVSSVDWVTPIPLKVNPVTWRVLMEITWWWDVAWPWSSTDEAIARFDWITWKLLQNSLSTVSDTWTINIPTWETYNINGTPLAKWDVWLGNVDNVADASQTSLWTVTSWNVDAIVNAASVWLWNVDNIADANQTTLWTVTSWDVDAIVNSASVWLWNVDNTSDSTKNSATVTLSNKTVNTAKWWDIASAATTDIWAATGNFVDITWTTTITAFWTVQAWTWRTLQFDWILILTHNGTSLILPTGANITTAAWDTCDMRSLWSGDWVCVNYQRADWTALAAAWWGWVTEIFEVQLSSWFWLTTWDTKISFNTENVDTGSNYDTSTFIYTAPTTWTYFIYGELAISGLTDQDRVVTNIAVGGTTRALTEARCSSTQLGVSISKILSLTASDTVIMRIRNATASRGTITSGTGASFGWYKLD